MLELVRVTRFHFVEIDEVYDTEPFAVGLQSNAVVLGHLLEPWGPVVV